MNESPFLSSIKCLGTEKQKGLGWEKEDETSRKEAKRVMQGMWLTGHEDHKDYKQHTTRGSRDWHASCLYTKNSCVTFNCTLTLSSQLAKSFLLLLPVVFAWQKRVRRGEEWFCQVFLCFYAATTATAHSPYSHTLWTMIVSSHLRVKRLRQEYIFFLLFVPSSSSSLQEKKTCLKERNTTHKTHTKLTQQDTQLATRRVRFGKRHKGTHVNWVYVQTVYMRTVMRSWGPSEINWLLLPESPFWISVTHNVLNTQQVKWVASW